MNRNHILVILACFFFLSSSSKSEEVIETALLNFFVKLGSSNGVSASNPCMWKGVSCDAKTQVRRLLLDGMNLSGTFDPSILCNVQSLAESLTVISLNENNLHSENLDHISNCTFIKMLSLRGNRFSGSLPDSFSRLNNLMVFEISNNLFSGSLPDLSRITGLVEFLVQDNRLSGPLPSLNYTNLEKFNVSMNGFTGRIPDGGSNFPASSYIYNPELCGNPLPNECSSARAVLKLEELASQEPEDKKKSRSGPSTDQILMFVGYFLVGIIVIIFVLFKFCRKGKEKEDYTGIELDQKKVAAFDESNIKLKIVSVEGESVSIRSNILVTSTESAVKGSPCAVVSTSPEVNGLQFDELLKAPAELLGRGKHGSVYKVMCESIGKHLTVKRIKDSTMSSDEFKKRMKKLDQLRHPNVLPPVAFYTSKEEKLIVYEYQSNGSLFNLIHGDQIKQAFDWSSRIGAAAIIAKALAFMQKELKNDAIGHGNLKSSNILLNQDMEPCLVEYGLINQEQPLTCNVNNVLATQETDDEAAFKSDIYAFGVILLEMLTGKQAVVQNNGMNLAKWVVSVVREEWTVEVFDKSLIRECASEERMVNLLQIAIKCVNDSPKARPSINQVALMINTLKEEDERSLDISDSFNL
ncbi:putative leucine-rich repeat receptor-like protein kinase At1g68400 [Apium graveolens]|uniref:putative leucine-rich repeat receptor-like protein kinase At1g68400 n=1 Tax=Apium graveolens TaxID=4045 RepID=UPI003D7BA37F